MVKAESPKAYVLTEKGRHSILTLNNKTNLWNEFTFCKSLKSKFDVSNGGKAEVHDNLSEYIEDKDANTHGVQHCAWHFLRSLLI